MKAPLTRGSCRREPAPAPGPLARLAGALGLPHRVFALDDALDAVACVEHPATQALLDGEVVDEGPEPDTLDDARDVELERFHGLRSDLRRFFSAATKRLLMRTNSLLPVCGMAPVL